MYIILPVGAFIYDVMASEGGGGSTKGDTSTISLFINGKFAILKGASKLVKFFSKR